MIDRILYNGTKRIPEAFTESEINSILKQLLNCEDYWKGSPSERFKKGHAIGEWGQFFKIRDITLIATMYLLALRPKEACALRFEDFNFQNSTVKIRGMNNKVRKDRIIPFPVRLIKFYNIYLGFPRARFWRGSPYLFPSLMGGFVSPSTLKTTFREKALKPLGLWNLNRDSKAQYRTLYKLRHSRASHILKNQIKKHGKPDLDSIANFLGHSDIRSTRVYLHQDENYMEYLRKEIEID